MAGHVQPRRDEAVPNVQPILAHQFSMLAMNLLTMQPRTQLMMVGLSGDTVAVASKIGIGAAGVGLLELLFSPHLGALSDRVGRRPLMLMAPALTLPLKVAVVMKPAVPILLVERIVSDALRTFGGTTMSCICLAD